MRLVLAKRAFEPGFKLELDEKALELGRHGAYLSERRGPRGKHMARPVK
jgi:hypothetical protein